METIEELTEQVMSDRTLCENAKTSYVNPDIKKIHEYLLKTTDICVFKPQALLNRDKSICEGCQQYRLPTECDFYVALRKV